MVTMDAELEARPKAATQDLMRVMADDSVDKRAVAPAARA
jgi:hypothetical protein